MSNSLATTNSLTPETIEKVLLGGNLKALQPIERLAYYNNLCESLGMNPLTRPFDYVEFQQKLVLYLNKGGAEQLRKIHKVSLQITAREKIDEVYVVTARAKLPDGREDESTGALVVGHLKGDALANAFMKAETKAKRRVTISICGLNMLDDSEVDTIKGAQRLTPEEVAKMPAEVRDVSPGKTPADEGIAAAKAESNPWEYKVPNPFGKIGGQTLRTQGVDGVVKLVGWLKDPKRQPLTDQYKEFLWYCETALKTRQKPDEAPNFEGDFEDGDTILDVIGRIPK